MRDLAYYQANRSRYEQALPKLRAMVEDIEYKLHGLRIIARIFTGDIEELPVIKRLENKRAAILIQIGRIQGILTILGAPIKETAIKTLYAETLIDMIKSPNKERFLEDWYILRGLDMQLHRKGLRTVIAVGSEDETRR